MSSDPPKTYMIVDFESSGITKDAVAIEVSAIFCDEDFNIKAVYESLIKRDMFKDKTEWSTEDELEGYRVHQIPLDKLKALGKARHLVEAEISELVRERDFKNIHLVSDNSYFDMTMWKKTFPYLTNDTNPDHFHYRSFDSKMFVDQVGLERTHAKTHRSLQDAFVVYKDIIRAKQKLGNFKI